MKSRFNRAVKLATLAGAMVVAAGASAQSAGQWSAEVGFNKITPKVDSGDVSAPALPGSKADVGANTRPVLLVGYAVTDNISALLGLGLPYKHTLYGAGSIQGTGKLGTVESLPPTLFAQYHLFEPKAMFRPYVGLGMTYAYFQKATGSGQLTAVTNIGSPNPVTFKIENKLAATGQLGVTAAINERWFADLAITKTKLKTKVTFSTGQTQQMTLDPQAVAFTVGYKF